MSKSDDKSRVLGDDPLAWLSSGKDEDKKLGKKPVKKSVKKSVKTPAKTELKAKNQIIKKSRPRNISKTDQSKVEVRPPKIDVDDKLNHLVLESSLVINKAGDLYESLKKLSASGQGVEIDASKVEIIDSAILQLLFAFVLNLKEMGVSLSWHKPSEGMLNKASILGLTEKIGL